MQELPLSSAWEPLTQLWTTRKSQRQIAPAFETLRPEERSSGRRNSDGEYRTDVSSIVRGNVAGPLNFDRSSTFAPSDSEL